MIDNFKDEYGFLSNFYPSKISYHGIEYPTVEHAFQAMKTMDIEERKYIAKLESPSLAKRAGRIVKLRADWEKIKDCVMLDCLRLKFAIPELREKLLNTNNAMLIEGNTWHDNYWGDCKCEKCKHITGKNKLGYLLNVVRNEIKIKNTKILIVVDMQNDFINGALGTREAQAIVPNVKNKINEYLNRGDTIIFTRDTHGEDYLRTAEGKKLPVEHCMRNTVGWEIPSDIVPDNAYCIDKETFGYAFWNHERRISEPYIRGNNCTIEIVGLCTDICVISNALIIKAVYPQANIVVDATCCAGVTPETHEAALLTMKSCQIDVIN